MTAIQSLHGRLESTVLHPTAVVASTAAGATKIDLAGYEGHAIVLLNAAAGGSGVTLNVKLRHCDTVDGTYADISGAAFAAGVANTAQNGAIQINTNDVKRFIEPYFTIAGGSNTGAIAMHFVGQQKYNH